MKVHLKIKRSDKRSKVTSPLIPITHNDHKLNMIKFNSWAFGLVVWFSLWVREVDSRNAPTFDQEFLNQCSFLLSIFLSVLNIWTEYYNQEFISIFVLFYIFDQCSLIRKRHWTSIQELESVHWGFHSTHQTEITFHFVSNIWAEYF